MQNSQNLYERISFIAKERKMSLNKVRLQCGLGQNFFVDVKKGSIPRGDNLKKIADCLGVSVEYLMNGSTTEPTAIIMNDMPVHMIPLYESVSAGFGAYADNTIIEYIPCFIVSKSEAEETICVKVQGDSMAPKIEDGDVIQVHRQSSVDSGSIAVLLIDGEDAVVKRVIFDGNAIELQSLNTMYAPRRFEGKNANRVTVLGVVKKIIKEV